MPDYLLIVLERKKSKDFSRGRRALQTATSLLKLSRSLTFHEFQYKDSCPESYGGDEGENNPSMIILISQGAWLTNRLDLVSVCCSFM